MVFNNELLKDSQLRGVQLQIRFNHYFSVEMGSSSRCRNSKLKKESILEEKSQKAKTVQQQMLGTRQEVVPKQISCSTKTECFVEINR